MKALVVQVLLLPLLLTGVARADVVMPPPDRCPDGQVPTTSHEGARCAPAAPTDCLPGWRGVIGGDCVLHTCSADEACGPGRRCVDQDLCFRPWVHRRRHSNEQVTDSRAEDVCGPSCRSPGECRPSRVCLPPGMSAAAAPGRPAPAPAAAPQAAPAPEEKRRWPHLAVYAAGAAALAVGVVVVLISRRRRK